MMNLLRVLPMLIVMVAISEALICWTCENEPNNASCLKRGRERRCLSNEQSCENEIRRGSYGILITKRCKQPMACNNNMKSNKHIWWPAGTRCNARSANSLCSCCCHSNNCNKRTIGCQAPPPVTAIPEDVIIPTTVTQPPTFSPTTVERNPTPERPRPTCKDIGTPIHGSRMCHSHAMINGRFQLETECEFTCDEGFVLEGSPSSTCLRMEGSEIAIFDNMRPVCRLCEGFGPIQNGDVSCTDQFNSVCYFECNAGYSLYPQDVTTTTCRNDSTWTTPAPCCLRDCPPNAFMDLIILLDSSESIGIKNWELMKDFVRNLIQIFTIGPEAARISVFRFDTEVDTETQIRLRDFPDDKVGLLRALDEIPYKGQGSDTGKALQYALDEMLRTTNGDRKAPNVVLVITDGEADDDEAVHIASYSLRAEGVFTFAVGVVPLPPDQLHQEQLEVISGSPENLFIAEGGFEDLDVQFSKGLGNQICKFRTCEWERLISSFYNNYEDFEESPK